MVTGLNRLYVPGKFRKWDFKCGSRTGPYTLGRKFHSKENSGFRVEVLMNSRLPRSISYREFRFLVGSLDQSHRMLVPQTDPPAKTLVPRLSLEYP
jgi:hypothetical protein